MCLNINYITRIIQLNDYNYIIL
uniref:Uncharacterized protein n=1 Tax=Rhizophora mucronata TaxID=61149 RepID=A0A2P2QGA5_RHIMU